MANQRHYPTLKHLHRLLYKISIKTTQYLYAEYNQSPDLTAGKNEYESVMSNTSFGNSGLTKKRSGISFSSPAFND